MKNANYAKLTTGLILVWFLLSLAASALHLYRTGPDQPPLPLGLAVLIPIGIFLLWAAASQPFRQFLLSLNPSTLTYIQAWRIAGFVFLALYSLPHSAGSVRAARRLGRYRNRCYGAIVAIEPCQSTITGRVLSSGNCSGLLTWSLQLAWA